MRYIYAARLINEYFDDDDDLGVQQTEKPPRVATVLQHQFADLPMIAHSSEKTTPRHLIQLLFIYYSVETKLSCKENWTQTIVGMLVRHQLDYDISGCYNLSISIFFSGLTNETVDLRETNIDTYIKATSSLMLRLGRPKIIISFVCGRKIIETMWLFVPRI